jgi:hypothetical protein
MIDKASESKSESSLPGTIAQMRVGDRAYTDPMALAPLRDGTNYLHGGFSIQSAPDEVSRMLIERVTGGWVAYASQVKDPNWRLSRGLPWPGVSAEELMPVIRIE